MVVEVIANATTPSKARRNQTQFISASSEFVRGPEIFDKYASPAAIARIQRISALRTMNSRKQDESLYLSPGFFVVKRDISNGYGLNAVTFPTEPPSC